MNPSESLLIFTRVPKNDYASPIQRSAFADSKPSYIRDWYNGHGYRNIDKILSGARISNLSCQKNITAEYYRVIVEPLLSDDSSLSTASSETIDSKTIDDYSTPASAVSNLENIPGSEFTFENPKSTVDDSELDIRAFTQSTLSKMYSTPIKPESASKPPKPTKTNQTHNGGPIESEETFNGPSIPHPASPVRISPRTISHQPSRPILRERPSMLQKLTAKLRKSDGNLRA